MESWHNFFYNAFDPGGFVSVDKPPVALWVQVLSAKLFGFSQLSILAPQAIMGTLSVLILWHLVRRHFGALAAFLAALALAVMPISVAVERTNNYCSSRPRREASGCWHCAAAGGPLY